MTPMQRLTAIEHFEALLAKYAALLRRAYPPSKQERAAAKAAVVGAYAKLLGGGL